MGRRQQRSTGADTRLIAALLICAAAGASGCGYNVYSPPARGLPFDSAATLPRGKTGVALEGGQAGEVFGPDVFAIGARVRRGLAEGVDGVVEANVLRVLGESDSTAHRNVYALRVGTKLRPWKHLAFTGGVGGGGSAGGGFISPDLGVVLAWENPYVVPLVGARGMFSQPIGAQRVDLGRDDEDEDAEDDTTADPSARHSDTPRSTWGGTLFAGARIPLQHASEAGPSFVLSVSWSELATRESHAGFGALGASFELVF